MRYIYMVRVGLDNYKVGMSGNVLERVKGIQTGNGEKVELVTAVPAAEARKVEQDLHKHLGAYKMDGGMEWFKLTPEQAINLAIKITSLGMEMNQYLSMRHLLHRQQSLENKYIQFTDRMNSLLSENTREGILLDADTAEDINEIKEEDDTEDLIESAMNIITVGNRASTSYLQRRLRVGYSKAARIMDELEARGFVGPSDGARPREIIASK